nr:PaaI family thioesterase [Desulforamulus aquiferis]
MINLGRCGHGTAIRTLGRVGVTVNLNTNFIAPGKPGERIIARGKVVHQGNTMISTECNITREEDVLARSTGLWFAVK